MSLRPARRITHAARAGSSSFGRTGRRAATAGWAACALALLAATGCVGPSAPGRADRTWRITPLLEFGQTQSGGTLVAVRPFYSRLVENSATQAVTDVVWPISTFHRTGRHLWWRAFPAYGSDDDLDDPQSRDHFWLLPIYFQGRTREGDDYRALFPLAGEVRDIATLDRARFYLFPLYADYDRGSVQSTTWLWPIYSRRTAPDLDQFSLFPIYGRAEHRDSVEWTRRYVLWPFWTQAEMRGPVAHGHAFILFPLYGRVDLDRQQTWMVLPPFISYTRAPDGYRRLYAPWPFVQAEEGRRHRRYLWPLFGWQRQEETRQWFAAWPIAGGEHTDLSDRSVSRFYLNPIFYRERRTASDLAAGPAADSDYLCLWPLVSWQRRDGAERLRIPELNLFRGHAAIERNWAPLWSLFTRHRAPALGTRTELLWGLAAWGRTPAGNGFFDLWPLLHVARQDHGTEWSLLEGLAARTPRVERGAGWRLFWLPTSDSRTVATSEDAP